jgi:hypothetical protein
METGDLSPSVEAATEKLQWPRTRHASVALLAVVSFSSIMHSLVPSSPSVSFPRICIELSPSLNHSIFKTLHLILFSTSALCKHFLALQYGAPFTWTLFICNAICIQKCCSLVSSLHCSSVIASSFRRELMLELNSSHAMRHMFNKSVEAFVPEVDVQACDQIFCTVVPVVSV